MIFILYIRARFSTAARRDRAITQVNNYVAANVPAEMEFTAPNVTAYDAAYKGWPNAMVVELHLTDQATRDGLWTTLDAFLSTASNAPSESFGEKWDQLLDAPDPDADTTRYNELSKTW